MVMCVSGRSKPKCPDLLPPCLRLLQYLQSSSSSGERVTVSRKGHHISSWLPLFTLPLSLFILKMNFFPFQQARVSPSSISMFSQSPHGRTPCSPLTSPIASALSPARPAGLLRCCPAEAEWVARNEVGGCDVSASGWAPRRPHCLCWMRIAAEAGAAWAGAPTMAVSSPRSIPRCCPISGSGSSGTPGRS